MLCLTKYITVSGDMWDAIVLKMMGSESYTNDLIEANSAHTDTVIFNAGIELVIPEVKAAKLSSLPPWKR